MMKKRILFISAIPLYPAARGGAEISLHTLFSALWQRGIEIECICEWNVNSRSLFLRVLMRLQRILNVPIFKKDKRLGYAIWRGNFRSPAGRKMLDKLLRRFKPDIVFGNYYMRKYDLDLLKKTADRGIPTYCYVQILDPILRDNEALPKNIGFIANSYQTQDAIREFSDTPAKVVFPLIRKENYLCLKKDPRYILFINPVPPKGLFQMMDIVKQLPDEKFLVVPGNWSFADYTIKNRSIRQLYSIPNVTVSGVLKDMRKAYEVSKILILPSQWIEAFARVILEAQVNGIPVVASNRGGIPYTLGEGGILVDDYEHAEGSVRAIRRLTSDQDLYNQRSVKAVENSRRKEFDPDAQVEGFIDFVFTQ